MSLLNNRNILEGIIIKGIGGFYYVKTATGIIECKARGKFRNDKVLPYVGDHVRILELGNGKGNIEEILPRANQMIRPPVANIERLILVMAVTAPDPDLGLVDKLLVTAESKGIETAICINKTDLDSGEKTAAFRALYENAGYRVIEVSAEKGEGMELVSDFLKDKVSAFAGNSGVGKSSILRHITGKELETGTISEKTERGRHTTRHVELLELPFGGFVLDTPGFSTVDVEGIKADELRFMFPEMEKEEGNCRFRGCSHTKEPGCSVRAMVENGAISESRYKTYCDLYEQLSKIKEWQLK